MLLSAVFFLSLSSLAFEVLLTRVFSISQWNHLSFMVISIALLGFAASGIFLSLLEAKKPGWSRHLASKAGVAAMTALYSAASACAFIALNRIPLDYMRLPIEPVQALYLVMAYLLLALPFFFSGLVICAAYALVWEKTGIVYFLSMAGSALGAALPGPLLPYTGEERLILITALLPLPLIAPAFEKKKRGMISFAVLVGLAITAMQMAGKPPGIIRIEPSFYKSLFQAIRLPDTRIVETRSGLRGRIDVVESPYTRFAPGLSLKFRGKLPPQESVFIDGDSPLILYGLHTPQDGSFCRHSLSGAGYLVPARIEKVLVLLHGGGTAIPCAIASGAKDITVVEQHPYLAAILENRYRLRVVREHPLSFLAGHPERFSVIHIENWGPSLPGTAALDQHYGLTVDAFAQYLKHLSDGGVLILSRKLLLPPADAIRLWATVYEAMRAVGIKTPGEHIGMLRNWDTFALIASNRPLDDPERLKKFAREMNFDLVYLPGLLSEEANRFNVFAAPYHHLEISRLAQAYRSGTQDDFFRLYPLDVTPQSSDRPFPNRYLKWQRVKSLYQATGSRFYSLFLSGEIVVAVVFFEALGVSLLLLGAPLLGFLRRARPALSMAIYFLSVGAGFMFVELYFIKAFTLLTGHPVISFGLVLAGMLIFSGAGGYGSRGFTERSLPAVCAALALILGAARFAVPLLIDRLLVLPETIRYPFAFLILFPFGFLLGIPFPVGMRTLLGSPGQRAYGWAINGCASVLTSIVAVQIALSFGIRWILMCAAGSYLAAWLCLIKRPGRG